MLIPSSSSPPSLVCAVIYRDLKPENIMLDADGYVRITDLGLCAFIKEGERLHKHCGTRSYMAPEQCHGNQGYGKAADWWSLGVTVYQLLTGKNPFSHRKRGAAAPRPPKPDRPAAPGPVAGQHAAYAQAGGPAFFLGPLAVDPGAQQAGLGIALVHAAVAACRAAGGGAVVLVGAERFFRPAGFSIVPKERVTLSGPVDHARLLWLELRPGGLDKLHGELTAPR